MTMRRFGVACALVLTATAPLCAANLTVESLVETTISDIIFWATSNQTWAEADPRICVFDPTGVDTGGPGLCRTNIGYYVHACGLTYDLIYAPDHVMNFYLRFQIKDACHNAVVSDPVRGTYCAAWGEDWSRYPLSPDPHKFNVSALCTTTYLNGDPAQPALGCKNNFAPYSLESDAEWLQWKACQNPLDPTGTLACEAAQFAWETGWNWTVLAQMVDLVLQNGNDCQKWFEGRQYSYDPSTWTTLCEAGDVPAPAEHQVLLALQEYKNFSATWEKPYQAKVSFSPSPPSPPNPPPSPPSPPSPPPSPSPPPPPPLLQVSASNNPVGGPGSAGLNSNGAAGLSVSAAASSAPAALMAALALLAIAALLA